MVDKIKGGLADSKSLQDIADKHSVSLSAIESALADGIKIESEHTTDAKVAEEIAKDHLFEDAEYYSKLANMEKQSEDVKKDGKGRFFTKDELREKTNSKDWAKTYKASNFIEKGVCTYNDETIYLSQEALNKAIASIKGRPVVIKHQKVTPQNMEDHAVGYVSGCGFSEWDASFYCDFLVFDDEGKEVIAKDYSVSCAYIPKAFGKGGTWHNTPYDREVTELEFTHLALVPDPRYEDAKIYENSKDNDNTTKETYNMENEKVEVPTALLDKLFGFIQQPFLNAKEEPKDKEDVKVDDDEMEYEGKKYSKKELVNAYEAKCNAESEGVKGLKKFVKEEEEEEEHKEEEKKNSTTDEDMEFFNSMQALMATASQDADDKVEVHSQNKGLELGSKAFG